MGDVHHLNSRQPNLEGDFYARLIDTSQRQKVCQFISKTLGGSSREIFVPKMEYDFSFIAGDRGNVSFHETPDLPNGRVTIAVPPTFPRILEADLPREAALDMAADFSIGFAIFKGSQRRALSRRRTVPYHKTRDNFDSSLWVRPYSHPEGLQNTLPYRAAGFIALKMSGANEGETFRSRLLKAPYLPHFAGLANPINGFQFGEFHSILRH